MDKILFLVSGFSRGLKGSSPDLNKFVQPNAKFKLFIPSGLVKALSQLIKGADIIFLSGIIIGMLLVIYSNIATNGENRERGENTIKYSLIPLGILHLTVIFVLSLNSLGGLKFVIFIIMFLGQLLLYVGAPLMFIFGIHYLEMYDMTSQMIMSRYSTTAFKTMRNVLLGGAVVLTIMEMI